MDGTRLVGIGFLVALLLVSSRSGAASPRWLRVAAPGGLGRATALAIDPAHARLAAGGERGVALGGTAGPLERVLSRGPVADLLFARGHLWTASEAGLYRVEGSGRVFAETLAPGEAPRDVRDLDAEGARLAAATAAGVFQSEAPGVWRRVPGLPQGEAARVLWSPAAGGSGELWALQEGALWRAAADGRAERIPLPGSLSGEGAVDLVGGAAGELLVLLPRSLAWRDAAGGWHSERLVLPPGALPSRLLVARGRLWIASDAGLLESASPAGPWRRATAPVGHISVSALAGNPDTLIVATSQGLFRASSDPGPQTAGPGTDPPIQAVHRMALRYLELEPARMHALARAADRRAWWPALRLRVEHDRGRSWGRDDDQSFVSGAKRFLVDRDRGRDEDLSASVELVWELGDTVYTPERIDVSRESRLVAQLRDDVLDEINQLYFERQRILAALLAPPPDAAPAALRLRAAELAAGIDAWTGGGFSAEVDARTGGGFSAEVDARTGGGFSAGIATEGE